MNFKGYFGNWIRAILFYIAFIGLNSFQDGRELSVFVSPNGNDNNNGSIGNPVRTVSKAKSLVKKLRANNVYSKITVNLMAGEYPLTEPLDFTPSDGGTITKPIIYAAYKNSKVIISGGKTLNPDWVKSNTNKNLWRIKIGNEDGVFINQLFADGKRVERSRSPMFYTIGPIKANKGLIEEFNSKGTAQKVQLALKLRGQDLFPFCSFSYKGSDLNDLNDADINNSEIMVYHSLECSWHAIGKIDKTQNEVYFKSPSIIPVGIFSNRNRYVVENTKRYLTPGHWLYDAKSNEIWYLANGNENPNTIKFVIPVTQRLIQLTSDQDSAVQNITFSGIQFKYTVAPRGVHWNIKYMMPLVADPKTPWLNLKTGFSGLQAATECGEAIILNNAKNISFENCDFSNLGGYAVRVNRYSDSNKIINCQFSDLGGGGVIIGNYDLIKDQEKASPANNIIRNSKIHDFGKIYLSAIGIVIMNAVKSDIDNNEIYNSEYSGISSGWTFGRGKSYTRENIIENNNIHHVMRSLADGGGIYTLGTQTGTVIKGNTIHDIDRSPDAVGSRNNGIFFDEGSARIYLDNNKIYNIQNETVRYNGTTDEKISWGTNEFDHHSVTGNNGQPLLQNKKFEAWFHDERFRAIVNGLLDSDWIMFSPLLLIIIIIIIIRRNKMKKQKRYRKNLSNLK